MDLVVEGSPCENEADIVEPLRLVLPPLCLVVLHVYPPRKPDYPVRELLPRLRPTQRNEALLKIERGICCRGNLVAKLQLVGGDHGDVVVHCQDTRRLDLGVGIEPERTTERNLWRMEIWRMGMGPLWNGVWNMESCEWRWWRFYSEWKFGEWEWDHHGMESGIWDLVCGGSSLTCC